jgi:hypothetical protein
MQLTINDSPPYERKATMEVRDVVLDSLPASYTANQGNLLLYGLLATARTVGSGTRLCSHLRRMMPSSRSELSGRSFST